MGQANKERLHIPMIDNTSANKHHPAKVLALNLEKKNGYNSGGMVT